MEDSNALSESLRGVTMIIGVVLAFIGPYRIAVRIESISMLVRNCRHRHPVEPAPDLKGVVFPSHRYFLLVLLFLILESSMGALGVASGPYDILALYSLLPTVLVSVVASSPLLFLPHQRVALATVRDSLEEGETSLPEPPKGFYWLMVIAMMGVIFTAILSYSIMQEERWMKLTAFLTGAFTWYLFVSIGIRKALDRDPPRIVEGACAEPASNDSQ